MRFLVATFRRRRRPGCQDDAGFTLIELLTVMVILGLLVALALPIFLQQRQKAHETAVKSDVKQLATAVESALTAGNPSNFLLSGATGGAYQISFDVDAVADSVNGRLSPADSAVLYVDDTSNVTHYCVAVHNGGTDVAAWQVADEHLSRGDCSDPSTNAGASTAAGSTS